MATQTRERPTTQQRDPQTTGAIVPHQAALERVTGGWFEPSQVNAALQLAAAEFNLITPAQHVGALPEGCGIALSAVTVNVPRETYAVTGGRALSKSAINKVAAAMGIGWIPRECYRVDDRSDPHYCYFNVAGQYRAFDSQMLPLVGHKEMDLRDGSAQCRQIEAEVDKHNADPRNSYKRDPIAQIRMMRIHIVAHAETKAKLRATRDVGVRASYTDAELARGFVCARIMFTGKSADPRLREMFAEKIADSFLAASNTLYSLPATPHEQHLKAPPPVGAVAAEPDDLPPADDGDYTDAEPVDPHDDPPPPRDPPPRERKRSEPPVSQQQQRRTTRDESLAFTIPGGKNKGTPLSKASDNDLQYWADRIGRELDAGQSRDAARDTDLHAALCDEIASRENEYDRQQELRT